MVRTAGQAPFAEVTPGSSLLVQQSLALQVSSGLIQRHCVESPPENRRSVLYLPRECHKVHGNQFTPVICNLLRELMP